jgi:hypothetical protein
MRPSSPQVLSRHTPLYSSASWGYSKLVQLMCKGLVGVDVAILRTGVVPILLWAKLVERISRLSILLCAAVAAITLNAAKRRTVPSI